ncbi:MAG: aminotransferase class V-fold PLP-dependent enzyme [Chloroflexota bacterium]
MTKNLTTSYKDLFLLNKDVVFLNHGSFGATPRSVFEYYQRWQLELERQPVEFLGRRAKDLLLHSRADLATFLHTQAGNLVYVTNATTGLNIIARSLRLGSHDEILASDHEYGALDRTWKFLSQRNGFKYINQKVNLPANNSADIINDLWRGVTDHTRVIFISHLTSPTAMLFPVEEICARARQQGILTIVDGAHAVGQVDLNLETLAADFYVGNLHKWLCAPKGAAFLYARPSMQHLIEPLIVSWGWDAQNPGKSSFVELIEWSGTRDLSPFLAVPEAIRFRQQLDWQTLQRECHRLASLARNHILQVTRLPALCPDSPQWYVQMAAIPIPAQSEPELLQKRLYHDYRVEVPILNWNGRTLLRVSIQIYNTEADIQALKSALFDIL